MLRNHYKNKTRSRSDSTWSLVTVAPVIIGVLWFASDSWLRGGHAVDDNTPASPDGADAPIAPTP